jgi:protein subunit release factor B
MIDFGTSPEKQNKLYQKMAELGIFENDLEEKFIRSGGKGGQNVNKVSTAVYLKHLPTGIEVKAQMERSQLLNRYRARQILIEKIDQLKNKALSEKQQAIEKIKRQKRKRSKRAKNKMIDDKKKHGQKKSLRRSPPEY